MPDMLLSNCFHLVIGGELIISNTHVQDLDQVEVVGVYPTTLPSMCAWNAKARRPSTTRRHHR